MGTGHRKCWTESDSILLPKRKKKMMSPKLAIFLVSVSLMTNMGIQSRPNKRIVDESGEMSDLLFMLCLPLESKHMRME